MRIASKSSETFWNIPDIWGKKEDSVGDYLIFDLGLHRIYFINKNCS